MRNYIKAELYRSFNRMYFWCMTGSIAILALLGNILLFRTTSTTNADFTCLFEMGRKFFGMPIYIILMIIDMVTSEEQKNNTLKNVVSFGISREKIILSKIITSIILSVISALIILIVYFGSGTVLFKFGSSFSISVVIDFIVVLLSEMVLWTAAIIIGNLTAIVFRNSTAFAFVYAGLFIIPNRIIYLLSIFVSDKFKYVYNSLLSTQISNLSMPKITSQGILTAVLTGIVYIIVFTILNIVYFRNMEVK